MSFKPVLQKIIDNPDRFLDEIRADADRFAGTVLAEEGEPLPPSGAIPTLDSIVVIVFRGDGTVVHEVLPDWWAAANASAFLIDQLADGSIAPKIRFLRHEDQRQFLAVCTQGAEACEWNLPYAAREALRVHPDSRLLLCVDGRAESRALKEAARSFGLSDLQQRAAIGVVSHGNARTAAEALGLSYVTVREALSGAARKIRAPNLPALVRRLVEASFGVMPLNSDSAAQFADWLPLTARQCQISELVAEGVSRQGVAAAMRLSAAVVKKELEQIFVLLGAGSAADLARIWAEAHALRSISRQTDGPLGFFDPAVEPTHFLPRADDREVIAWSDYGPASGKPVLLVHSQWTCRAVPRPMVLRLQAAGWRPIAIDRPGFGSTHPGTLSVSRPYDQAIADTIDVLDRLRIDRIAVLSRRAAHFTTALKHGLGDRIGPILLVAPSPPTRHEGRRTGLVGVIKEAFFRSPQLIEFYFRAITPQLSLSRMEKLNRAVCAGSPTDEALCDDPQFIRDRFRAIRPFSTGNLRGAIVEETQVSRNLQIPSPCLAADCAIVHGHQDNHYGFDEAVSYWSQVWPRARVVEVRDGGQFMTSSHAGLLVDLLEELAAN